MSAQQHSAYTENEERGARLNYLLCDVATSVCHSVFHQVLRCPQNPRDLFDHFHLPRIYNTLIRLKKPRGHIITEKQWDLMFPPSLLPDSRTFDITLWIVLLRNICSLPAPSNGWDQDPIATDNTLSANLVRLRLCRNRLRGHISSTSLSEFEFNAFWKEVEDILVALGCPKTEIDERKTDSLDPELTARYNDLLNELMTIEELMDKEINVIKEDQVRLKTRQQEIELEFENLQKYQGNNYLYNKQFWKISASLE